MVFDFYIFDNWVELIFVSVDGVSSSISHMSSDSTNVRNFCGNKYNDAFLLVTQNFTHSNYIASVNITTNKSSSMNPYLESWGFNNFQFSYFICDSTCLSCTNSSSTSCTSCYANALLSSSGSCLCNDGYAYASYKNPCQAYPCSQCVLCNEGCKVCNSSLFCQKCFDGFTLDLAAGTCQCDEFFLVYRRSTCMKPENCLPPSLFSNETSWDIGGHCYDCSTINYCVSCMSTGCSLCQATFFLNNTSSGLCQPCPVNCMYCINGSYCTQCLPNYYLYNHTCLSSCNPPTLWSNETALTNGLGHCYDCSGIKDCMNCASSGCSQCAVGYYLVSDEIGGSCPKCSDNCSYCTNSTFCTVCNQSFYLYNNSCLSYCNPPTLWSNETQIVSGLGHCYDCSSLFECTSCNINGCIQCNSSYYLASGAICTPCSSNCQNCTNSTYCSQCLPDFYLFNSSCLSYCTPPSLWTNETNITNGKGRCFTCDTISHCINCSDFGCNECPLAFYLNSSTSSGTCDSCSNNCQICTNSSFCSECQPGYFLYNNSCQLSCDPPTLFTNESNSTGLGHCYDCNIISNCSSCGSNGCIQCQSEFYLIPDGIGQCSPCSQNCSKCVNSTSCQQCVPNYFLYNESCLAVCQPPTLFTNESNIVNGSGHCYACSSIENCTNCSASGCVGCSPYNFLNSTGVGICQSCSSSCYNCQNSSFCKQCDSRYYLSQDSCWSCSQNCVNCTNSTFCHQCDIDYFLFNNTCIKCDPPTYFSNETTITTGLGHCYACSSISQCTNCTSTGCSQCSSGYYLNSTGIGSCLPCSQNCSICENSSICTQCFSNHYLYNNSCVDSCSPPSYYSNESQLFIQGLGHCFDCSCIEQCTLCNSTGCTNCSLNYFLNSSGAGICQACSQSCQICVNSTFCTQCLPNYYLMENTCMSSCTPPIYFSNESNNTNTGLVHCYKCSSITQCSNCNSSNCISCYPGYYLIPMNNESCQSCPINCQHCIDSFTCTQCNPNYYLYNNTCVSSCTPPVLFTNESSITSGFGHCYACSIINNCVECGTYGCIKCVLRLFLNQLGIGICQNCSSDCQNCQNLSYCEQCNPNLYLYEHKCLSSCDPPTLFSNESGITNGSGHCYACNSIENCTNCSSYGCSQCANGFFLNNTGVGFCQPCPLNCQKCQNSTTCTQCNANLYLYNGLCQSSCDAPVLFTNESSISGFGHCYSCSSIDQCILCGTSGCIQCPSLRYFLNSSGSGMCIPCSIGCLSCDNQTHCTNCSASFTLMNGTCFSGCICSGECTTCEGSNCDQCLSCNAGYYLYNSKCVSGCPYNYYAKYDQYIFSNVCMACDLSCRSCFGLSSQQCISCGLSLFLQNGSCVTSCSSQNFYPVLNNYTCNACDVSCLSCNGPNDNQCLVIFCIFMINFFISIQTLILSVLL